MNHAISLLPLLVALSACGLSLAPRGADIGPPVSVTEEPGDDVLRPRARGGEAVAPSPAPPTPAADGFLGETLAGLGTPGETGLWLRTGLVAAPVQGRVETETGRSLTLELRPSGAGPGAGSHLSLMAMQSLGLPLSSLASLRVFLNQ
ncbi:MAG: hypothetical protein Kow0013_22660 [Pararhodobacter sp.]